MPMFPLGTVLLPYGYLPLRVFEPRYQALTRDCLAGDHRFGVVLIERGSEVGGGDVRTGLGTVAHIVEVAELPGGQWLLGTVGTDRIEVVRWLDDDPYPRAEVRELPDTPPDDAAADLVDGIMARLRRVLVMKSELGEPTPPATTELAADLAVACWQVALLAPLGPVDAQRVLAEGEPGPRLRLLDTLLEEQETMLRFRLGGTA